MYLKVRQNIGCIFLPQRTLTDLELKDFFGCFWFCSVVWDNFFQNPFFLQYLQVPIATGSCLGCGLFSFLIIRATHLFRVLSHFYSKALSQCYAKCFNSDKEAISHPSFFELETIGLLMKNTAFRQCTIKEYHKCSEKQRRVWLDFIADTKQMRNATKPGYQTENK